MTKITIYFCLFHIANASLYYPQLLWVIQNLLFCLLLFYDLKLSRYIVKKDRSAVGTWRLIQKNADALLKDYNYLGMSSPSLMVLVQQFACAREIVTRSHRISLKGLFLKSTCIAPCFWKNVIPWNLSHIGRYLNSPGRVNLDSGEGTPPAFRWLRSRRHALRLSDPVSVFRSPF